MGANCVKGMLDKGGKESPSAPLSRAVEGEAAECDDACGMREPAEEAKPLHITVAPDQQRGVWAV
jgi:hypothetical protein